MLEERLIMSNIIDYKKLKEELFYENKNAFLRLDEKEIDKAYDFCEGYKQFLNLAKTEREAAAAAIALMISRITANLKISRIFLHLNLSVFFCFYKLVN